MIIIIIMNSPTPRCRAVTMLPRAANKTKIYYGLLKEPEVQSLMNEEDEADDDADKPKKKKSKKDALQKAKKNDPNAPPSIRIPLPEL